MKLKIVFQPRLVRLTYADGMQGMVFWRNFLVGGKSFDSKKHASKVSSAKIVIKGIRSLWLRFADSQALSYAIRHFMNNYHGKEDLSFDCYSFACLYAGVSQGTKDEIAKYWTFTKVQEKQLLPGDVIFLFGRDEFGAYFSHAAISIGKNLFVSVYGAGADLQISTFAMMTQLFAYDSFVRVTPKKGPM